MRDPHFRSDFRVQKWFRKVDIFYCDLLSSLLFSRRRSPCIAPLVASPIIPGLVSLLLYPLVSLISSLSLLLFFSCPLLSSLIFPELSCRAPSLFWDSARQTLIISSLLLELPALLIDSSGLLSTKLVGRSTSNQEHQTRNHEHQTCQQEHQTSKQEHQTNHQEHQRDTGAKPRLPRVDQRNTRPGSRSSN